MSLKKLEKSKTETLKFYDLSKPFSKENEVFEIQEARRKRIETFCSEKRSDDFLPQDSLRFTKMPKFESIYEFTTEDVQNPPAYIMTEDPIKRFLRYYHANARSSTKKPSKFILSAIKWKYSILIPDGIKVSVDLSIDEFAKFFLLTAKSNQTEIPLSLKKQVDKCHICSTQPKFQAKIETVSEDMKFLYDQFNIPAPHQKEKDEKNYIDLYKPKLSTSLLKELLEFYKDDYSTFDYNADQYLK
ncbi:Oidioi.mRNA.OKI2018_I69.chr1.g3112.t1.cds [Oikopleura dioica]|uniref:Oidioi.mRNA.OKI2018_I69.chr1.g3112.t1.cds n=1 Tax=Oikopleura dioica TaxID=34765 RepID=A0ABN7T2C9_OIKDI|nr:Oidioi.mRNA.OKI2018_I69.chr1.g3112.t1.cds [Oikopleura dioica]